MDTMTIWSREGKGLVLSLNAVSVPPSLNPIDMYSTMYVLSPGPAAKRELSCTFVNFHCQQQHTPKQKINAPGWFPPSLCTMGGLVTCTPFRLGELPLYRSTGVNPWLPSGSGCNMGLKPRGNYKMDAKCDPGAKVECGDVKIIIIKLVQMREMVTRLCLSKLSTALLPLFKPVYSKDSHLKG